MSKLGAWFKWGPFVLGLAVMLFLGLAVIGIYLFTSGSLRYKPHGHQAVFLTNGQVYFGVIQNQRRDEVQMTDIYYLQNEKSAADATSTDQSGVKLVKLGNELHGPEDRMYINRGQIIFIEDLKDDSKIVQAMQNPKP